MVLITNEFIFYFGIGISSIAIFLAVVCFPVYKMKKFKLNIQLEKEYGENEDRRK